MNPIKEGRELIGWSAERLAASCVCPVSEIEELEAASVVVADTLPVRVLRDRGCEFVSEHGVVVSVSGPLDISRLQQIRLSDREKYFMRELAYGPATRPFTEPEIKGRGSLRMNGLVEIGTVIETITFEGEKETRHGDRLAYRLSKKGWEFLRMFEAAGASEPIFNVQEEVE